MLTRCPAAGQGGRPHQPPHVLRGPGPRPRGAGAAGRRRVRRLPGGGAAAAAGGGVPLRGRVDLGGPQEPPAGPHRQPARPRPRLLPDPPRRHRVPRVWPAAGGGHSRTTREGVRECLSLSLSLSLGERKSLSLP